VRVSETDVSRLADEAHPWTRHVGGQAYLRMEDGHCSALQITTRRGEAPVFFCAIYDKRPQVCRDLARGKNACLTELHLKAAQVMSSYGATQSLKKR
jgi:Fe-S-cluster containining protein